MENDCSYSTNTLKKSLRFKFKEIRDDIIALKTEVLKFLIKEPLSVSLNDDGRINSVAEIEERSHGTFEQITQEEVTTAINGFTMRLKKCLK